MYDGGVFLERPRSCYFSTAARGLAAACVAWAVPLPSCVDAKGRIEQDSASSASAPYLTPLAGCEAHHTAPITIGGQEFDVWVDSGSSTLAVAAVGCSACESGGVTALYDTDHGEATGGLVRAGYGYTAGETGWSGRVYEDSVALAGVPSVSMKFAAVTEQGTAMFGPIDCDTLPNQMDGILGLGPRDLVIWPTEAYASVLRHEEGVPRAFAMRYCHTGGTLWLGGYEGAAIIGDMAYVPLQDNIQDAVDVTAVEVEPADGASTVVAVSDESDSLPASLDSGNDKIFLPAAAYDAVYATIAANPTFAAAVAAGEFEASPAELNASLPSLVFDLAGPPAAQLRLPALASYLSWFRETNGKYSYYWHLESDDSLPARYADLVTLGNEPMYSYVVYTDRENHRVGFALAVACEDQE